MSRSSPAPTYARRVTIGMLWVTGGTVLGRASGFLAQLVLGWILSQRDYGVYAIAISLSMIVLTLRSMGTQRILVQRGSEYDQLAAALAKLTLWVNAVGAAVLAIAAPWLAAAYDTPELQPMLWVIALSLPVGAPAQILRAKLSIDLRFRTLVAFDAASMVIRQLAMVVLAVAGFGAMSFVWPLVLSGLADGLLLWWIVGLWPAGESVSARLWREFWVAAKWILLCGCASTLIVQGNNLVLGLFESKETTGQFFFGFNLVAALAMMFNAGSASILMPTLSHFADDSRRQGEAYLKTARLLVAVAAPAAVFGFLATPSLIHWLWKGKWDDCIVVVRMLSLALPMYLMFAVGSAVLESRAQWRLNTLLHFANGIGTIAAACVGVWWGGLREIAITAAGFRFAVGLIHAVYVSVFLGVRPERFLHQTVPPLLASMVVGLVWAWCVDRMGSNIPAVPRFAMLCAGYLVGVSLTFFVLFRDRTAELLGLLKRDHG